jgi:acetolactate synthase-1/2/3 large subunit
LAIAQAIEAVRHTYDANVIFDGGNIGKWGKFAVSAERPGQWGRLKGGFGAIGHGLSSALVRKLTDQDRPVILLTGDGAFGYNVMEIEVCLQEQLPVVVVVAVDGAWGSVQTGLATRYLESTDSMYTRLPFTRFDRLAQSVGAQGIWIDGLDDLAPALHTAITSKQTWVIAVHTQTVQSPATYATDSY